jgi:hypothetical protein
MLDPRDEIWHTFVEIRHQFVHEFHLATHETAVEVVRLFGFHIWQRTMAVRVVDRLAVLAHVAAIHTSLEKASGYHMRTFSRLPLCCLLTEMTHL